MIVIIMLGWLAASVVVCAAVAVLLRGRALLNHAPVPVAAAVAAPVSALRTVPVAVPVAYDRVDAGAPALRRHTATAA